MAPQYIWMNEKGEWLIVTESNGHAGSTRTSVYFTQDITAASVVRPHDLPKECKGKVRPIEVVITRTVNVVTKIS